MRNSSNEKSNKDVSWASFRFAQKKPRIIRRFSSINRTAAMKAINTMLDPKVSGIVSDVGECFVEAHRQMEHRHPEQPGRWVIHLASWPLQVAHQSEGVLHGTHRAVKIHTSSKQ
jgi:hypothetical protein